jgi:hypothetical protein
MSEDWEAAAGLAAAEVQPLLAELFAAGAPPPTVGYELLGADGCVVAEAELAWVGAQIAVLLGEAHERDFLAAGWAVYQAADAAALADRLAPTAK